MRTHDPAITSSYSIIRNANPRVTHESQNHTRREQSYLPRRVQRPFPTISQISSTFVRELQPRYNDIPERPCVTISNRPISLPSPPSPLSPSLSLSLPPSLPSLFHAACNFFVDRDFHHEGIESNNNVGTER